MLMLAGCSVQNQSVTAPPPPAIEQKPPAPRAPGKLVNVSFYGGSGSNHKLSRKTASGEPFNAEELTAAHRTLPFGTKVRLSNPETGKEVVVRVNDRGPFIRGREMDITHAAAREIGMIHAGVEQVEMTVESKNR